MTPAGVTFLFGPRTRAGRVLNDIARERRGALADAGLRAYPSRVGDRLLKDIARDGAAAEGLLALELQRPPPALIVATKALGAPSAAFRSRELFPDAEVLLAGVAPVLDSLRPRVVLAIDPLPDLMFAMGHATANAAVRATRWDALYEVSWADLVIEVLDALPAADLTVLTTRAAFVAAEEVLPLVFGAGAGALDRDLFRRALVPAIEGREDLRGQRRLGEIFDTDAPRPDAHWLAEHLGIDTVTDALLRDRFAADMEAIRAMPRVRTI